MDNKDNENTGMEEVKSRFYSEDLNTSGLALGELIKMGKKGIPVLLEALTADNPSTRRIAVEGFGEIGDPAHADKIFQSTTDVNPEVRSRAATVLNKLGDPRALTAMVSALNDYPDILHNPYTDAMYPLMRSGKESLPLIVPLLKDADALTRERAFLIVRAVASRLPQVPDWNKLWLELGSYDPHGIEADRNKAAENWKEWVTKL